MSTVEAELERAGLVTLVGPGGAGKTRLAVEVAANARDRGATVHWTDLQAARTLSDFEREVRWAVGGPYLLADPVVQLAEEPDTLLVLDNVEQLPGEVAARMSAWLSIAHPLRILVTSRVPLQVSAERVVEVPPLEVPAEESALFEGAAWALLARHAPEGAVDGAAPSDVIRLIRALDGLPLALELAAGRLELLSLRDLLGRLDRLLDVVASPGCPDDRHASLRRVAEWSWALLSEAEQAALVQLSAFRGPFTLDAAEGVLDLDATGTLDAVHRLLRRHLLVREGGWLRLLEVIRAYAGEQRDHLDRAGAALGRHARWVTRTSAPDLPGIVDEGWLSAELRRLPEAYAVLDRAEGGRIPPRLAHDVWMNGLNVLASQRDLVALAAAAERLLALPDAEPTHRLRQLLARAQTRRLASDDAGAAEDLDAAEPLARAIGNDATLGEFLHLRGLVASALRDPASARDHLDRALELAVAAGDWRLLARCRTSQCRDVAGAAGYPTDPAHPAHQEALRLSREAVELVEGRDIPLWLGALSCHASMLSHMGRLEESLAVNLEAHAVASRVGAIGSLTLLEHGLGRLFELLGPLESAASHLERAWRLCDRLGRRPYAAFSRGYLGRVLVRMGRDLEGIEHMREALALRGASDAPAPYEGIEQSLEQATADDPQTWDLPTDDPAVELLRRAHRALDAGSPADLAAIRQALDGLPPPEYPADLLRDDLVERLKARLDAWRVARDGAGFRPPAGEPRAPGSNPANARILAHLAVRRLDAPGEPCAVSELFGAGWPGERAVERAQQNRVRVALSHLRRVGLRELLVRGRGGWMLDPAVSVEVVDELDR